ncbi:MAG: DUF3343 domain-containing protein [Anaerovorax sp.]
MNYLVTFHTHFDAIQYVRFLKKENILGTLKPVPRKISSSCGTCAFFTAAEKIDTPHFVTEGCEEIFTVTDGSFELLYRNPD